MEEITLQSFIDAVSRTLLPVPESPYYRINGRGRLNAFMELYGNARPYLLGNYPEFAKEVAELISIYQLNWADIAMLQNFGTELINKATPYLDKKDLPWLTPEQLLEAINSGIPLVATRCKGKRAIASMIYQLNRLIELDKQNK